MRGAWLVLLLLLTSGCFGYLEGEEPEGVGPADVEDDPSTYRVSSVRIHPDPDDPRDSLMVSGADGTQIAVKVYEPITVEARPNGDPIRFPVLYLLHGWGLAKEYFENAPLESPNEADPAGRVNIMEMFARQGFITVAYDIRGFGRSEGTVTLASAADVTDFLAVHRSVEGNFTTSGRVGVAGPSLGGGMSMRMLMDSGVVDAAASLFGWVDLYDALLPGDVPKAEWAVLLYGVGQGGSRLRLHNEINEWLVDAVQRTDLESVEAAMDTRSTRDRLQHSETPLFLCQGLHESLFPQAHLAWAAHGGFVRTHIYSGGHVSEEKACWDKTLDWMDYFLRGVDTGVDAWPFVQTVDVDPLIAPISYSKPSLQNVDDWVRYMHEEHLVAGPSQRTFTISNRVLSNPLQEPAVVQDAFGNRPLPERMREDPGAVFFDSGPLDSTHVVLGVPAVHLVPTNATRQQPFQVVATLYGVDADGNSRVLTRGAYANVAAEGEAPETVEIMLDWTKATLHAGDRVVLKLSGNDAGHYLPLPPDQQPPDSRGDRTFTGGSRLILPFFLG